MLLQSTAVDNATAGLAMKAYANIGLRDHWRSVRWPAAAYVVAVVVVVVEEGI